MSYIYDYRGKYLGLEGTTNATSESLNWLKKSPNPCQAIFCIWSFLYRVYQRVHVIPRNLL